MATLNGLPLDGGTIEINIAQSLADPLALGSKILGATGLGNVIGVKTPPSRLTGVEAVSFNHSLSTTKPKGVGQMANKGYTPGIIEVGPGSMEIWVQELADWINAYGGVLGFYNQQFDVTITYRTLGMPIQVIKLTGCRPIGVSTAHQLSTSDNLTATLDFGIMNISYGSNTQAAAGAVVSNAIRAFS